MEIGAPSVQARTLHRATRRWLAVALRLCIVALMFGSAPTWTTPRPQIPGSVAVIFDEGDEDTLGEFESIVAGIERQGDVVVYRLPLRAALDLAAAPRQPPANLVRLADNSGTGNIAVIYPDIGEPYRSVFAKIIAGIEEQSKTHVTSLAVGANVNTRDISSQLRRQDVRVVIVLGRHGLKVASSLEPGIGVIAGGVVSVPESEAHSFSVFSLAPDPGLLFGRLKNLLPSVTKMCVVYDPRQNAWLIRLAREAARARGLELVTYEAQDLKSAVQAYQQILATADPKKDAVWLPQDSTTVEESTVLPLVLQEAWNRNLAVFSSSVGHVKRGALFSLYPNSPELGRTLAAAAHGYLLTGAPTTSSMLPLKAVLVAVNLRTASHLGINLGGKQQAFDLVYPEP